MSGFVVESLTHSRQTTLNPRFINLEAKKKEKKMKKYVVSTVVLMLAFWISAGNVRAESSMFASASPLELGTQNLFENGLQNRYKLKITNKAMWIVTHVYVSSSESNDWGNDWLGENVLGRNDSLTISNLRPGEYDVKFIDEDADECILNSYAVFQNTSWILTSDWLAECQGY